jgi:hypothetical protein
MEKLLAIHEATWGTGQEQTLPIYRQRMADKAAKGPFGGFRVGLMLCRNPTCYRMENGNTAFSKCGACKGPCYCSRECQSEHWIATHKEECKKTRADRKDNKKSAHNMEAMMRNMSGMLGGTSAGDR